MLFFEMRFIIFFIILFSLYLMFSRKKQNTLLLIASYVFYGSWDWRFLFLLFATTLVDWYIALKIDTTSDQRRRKIYLAISMVANLGVLGFFKYYNFFISQFTDLLHILGLQANPYVLQVILPAGISFYTFQSMSYTIDVYRKKMKHESNFWDFALFVSFFPQLVAGPIERATRLVKQIHSDRMVTFGKFIDGLRLFIWGIFKKVVVADNLALIVDPMMTNPGAYSGWELFIAGSAFAFQIYCDFSGYTDMARGCARMMGFELMHNFNLPYFSKGIQEFWRRWHISLSTWLRDYLYIPLGGNRISASRTYINLNITMLLGGFWHGANWTFILWGAYQGIMMTIERVLRKTRVGQITIKAPGWLKIIVTFIFVVYGWLLFRAQNFSDVVLITKRLFSQLHLYEIASALLQLNFSQVFILINLTLIVKFIKIVGFLVLIEWIQYKTKDLEFDVKLPIVIRTFLYVGIIYAIIFFSPETNSQFIYFQF